MRLLKDTMEFVPSPFGVHIALQILKANMKLIVTCHMGEEGSEALIGQSDSVLYEWTESTYTYLSQFLLELKFNLGSVSSNLLFSLFFGLF